MGGDADGGCGVVLVPGQCEHRRAGAERRARAGREREAGGRALLGDGGAASAHGPGEETPGGDGGGVEGRRLASRRVVVAAGGRKEGSARGGAADRGPVPEVEFVRGGTQRPAVVAASWTQPGGRAPVEGVDGDPQLHGQTPRRHDSGGTVLRPKAQGCVFLAA